MQSNTKTVGSGRRKNQLHLANSYRMHKSRFILTPTRLLRFAWFQLHLKLWNWTLDCGFWYMCGFRALLLTRSSNTKKRQLCTEIIANYWVERSSKPLSVSFTYIAEAIAAPHQLPLRYTSILVSWVIENCCDLGKLIKVRQ